MNSQDREAWRGGPGGWAHAATGCQCLLVASQLPLQALFLAAKCAALTITRRAGLGEGFKTSIDDMVDT